MKKLSFSILCFLLTSCTSLTPAAMNLTSSAFDDSQPIPSKYTCDGEDISPQLNISEVPAGTKSLALIVDDPDAPSGDWVHWVVFNIPPTTTEITEGAAPTESTEGLTDFRRSNWGGPCPPSGTHRYFFKLYALDTNLDKDFTAKKIDIEQAMEGHILEEASLAGTYQRS